MANPALLQMLGCSSFEELVERNLEKEGFEPSYSRAEFINRIENEGRITGLESAWRRQDGATLFVRESARAVRDDSGRVLYYEGSVEDITVRKQAEEALRSLSLRQEVLLAAIPEIVMEVDSRKVYTWANRAGLDFFGDDVIGKEASHYFEGDQNTYEAVQPIFSGEEGTIYVESWQRRRDGQKRLLGWWCRALKDPRGNVIGALSSARDITDRRRANEALRESEQKYRSFVERAGDGILIIQEGVVKYVNPELARMWGGEPGGIIDRPFTDFVATADLDLVAEHYRRRLAGENIARVYRATLVRRDGTGVPTELNSEVIEYDGRPADFVIIRDLTERQEAEKKLKESEERLRLTLEATQIGIWDWDVKTDQWHVSPVYYSMLGYEPRPGLADRAEWLERVHPDDRARVQEEIQGVLSGHFLTYEYEARLRHADGTYHWVSVAGFNIKRDTDGKTTRILGTRMDITERKRAGEALRASEERYRRIAANIDGVLYSVDAETREFTYLSPAFERMLGYNEADVKEMGGRKEFLRRVIQYGDFMGQDEYLRNIKDHPATNTQHHQESWWRCKNGALKCLEDRWISVYEDDRLVSTDGVLIDVTERKRAEQALRDSEERFSTIFRASPVGTCITRHSDGHLADVNDAFLRLFGYSREEVIGHTALELGMWVKPEARNAVIGVLDQMGKVSDHELEIRTKSGEIQDTLISSELIELGGERYMVSLLRDITERKRAAAQVQAALDEKVVLLREVHHRVKNILQAMIALMDMRMSKEPNDEAGGFIRELKEQTRTMSLVYEQLYQSENLARVAMAPYLEKLSANVFEAFGGGRAIELQLDVATLVLDVSQAMPCGLIVNELLTNSLKHAFPEGFGKPPRVSIALGQEGKTCRLVVSDNGVGLPPGDDGRGSRSLGLRLVRLWATHQLGGELEVRREDGTSFRLTFAALKGVSS